MLGQCLDLLSDLFESGVVWRAVQVCILDGNKYTSRCREAGEQRLEILDECEVKLRCSKLSPEAASVICPSGMANRLRVDVACARVYILILQPGAHHHFRGIQAFRGAAARPAMKSAYQL